MLGEGASLHVCVLQAARCSAVVRCTLGELPALLAPLQPRGAVLGPQPVVGGQAVRHPVRHPVMAARPGARAYIAHSANILICM